MDKLYVCISLFDLKTNVSKYDASAYNDFDWDDIENNAFLFKKKSFHLIPLMSKFNVFTDQYSESLPSLFTMPPN